MSQLLSVDAGTAIDGLHASDRAIRRAYAEANRRLLERLLREAQSQAPVASGELRDSGEVRERTTLEGVQGSVVFTAPHALPVHEIPPPTGGGRSARVRADRRAKGGRTAYHPNGKWKYLEDPYLEMLPRWDAMVARDVAKVVSGLGGKK